MRPAVLRLMEEVKQNTRWTYKDQTYFVMTVTPGMLTQDPKGEWVPTVIYKSVSDKPETHVVGARTFNFARPLTEFVEKFRAAH